MYFYPKKIPKKIQIQNPEVARESICCHGCAIEFILSTSITSGCFQWKYVHSHFPFSFFFLSNIHLFFFGLDSHLDALLEKAEALEVKERDGDAIVMLKAILASTETSEPA